VWFEARGIEPEGNLSHLPFAAAEVKFARHQ
jgi:hypothetical protein